MDICHDFSMDICIMSMNLRGLEYHNIDSETKRQQGVSRVFRLVAENCTSWLNGPYKNEIFCTEYNTTPPFVNTKKLLQKPVYSNNRALSPTDSLKTHAHAYLGSRPVDLPIRITPEGFPISTNRVRESACADFQQWQIGGHHSIKLDYIHFAIETRRTQRGG